MSKDWKLGNAEKKVYNALSSIYALKNLAASNAMV